MLIAALGPLLAPLGATEYVGRPNTARVAGAILGTDHLGQDVWSRFLLGGRSILVIASVATAIGVLVGAATGALAAAHGGLVDQWIMRGVDVTLAVPPILLALVAMTTLGPEPWLITAAVALVTAPRVARVSYGAATVVVERDFVEVSDRIGETRWYVMTRDVLPNISGALLVEAGIRLTYAVAIVASLAFLGFTTGTNEANWAAMVQENRAAFAVQPWGVLVPTAAIVALTLGAGLITDGIARTTAGAASMGER
ncbi:ABC transporter permease [Ilumatobacter nonamiensis]|uniref:ABC transporter permease n=1 Tax=Ilumatobacter nonamiensis TaxID=467093 RepID=UPI00034BC20D|nr:ABC transporter permease [Ilumatobacter nonamiensis]